MKKTYNYLLTLLALLILAPSCTSTKTNEDLYKEWREENETYYDIKRNSEEYYTFRISKNRGGGEFLYKVLKQGDVTGTSPYYTSTVAVHYKGWDIKDKVFDKNYAEDELPWEYVPANFAVNGVIRGWTEALMHMRPGDKWEVVLPWSLAYGSNGSNSILPYSTLIFEMELLEVVVR